LTEHLGRDKYQARPDDHAKLLAELRLLTDSVLARVEPMLATFAEGQQRADRTSTTSSEELPAFSGCSWCPVCALAAAIRGEHHELLAVLAGHAATLLALLRVFLDKILGGRDGGQGSGPEGGPDGAVPTPDGPASKQPRPSAFLPIDVTVQR
jgi:hypothetical protein